MRMQHTMCCVAFLYRQTIQEVEASWFFCSFCGGIVAQLPQKLWTFSIGSSRISFYRRYNQFTSRYCACMLCWCIYTRHERQGWLHIERVYQASVHGQRHNPGYNDNVVRCSFCMLVIFILCIPVAIIINCKDALLLCINCHKDTV